MHSLSPATSSHSSDSSQQISTQPSIVDAFKTTSKLPSPSKRSKELTKSVAYFIGKDMQPVNVVQGIGFQQMLNTLEPRYQVPHRTTFMFQIFLFKPRRKLQLPLLMLKTLPSLLTAGQVVLTMLCHVSYYFQ